MEQKAIVWFVVKQEYFFLEHPVESLHKRNKIMPDHETLLQSQTKR